VSLLQIASDVQHKQFISQTFFCKIWYKGFMISSKGLIIRAYLNIKSCLSSISEHTSHFISHLTERLTNLASKF